MIRDATTLSKKRKRYYTMIEKYKDRKRERRKRYKIGPNNKFPDDYKRSILKVNKKIQLWQKYICLIDKKTRFINKLLENSRLFFHINLINKKGVGVKLARSVYYKYGLENGIPSIHLREAINIKGENNPAELRSWLTKSFSHCPENKDIWLRFKRFVERQSEISKAA